MSSYRDLLKGHAEGVGLDRLVRYAELLEQWSQVHNLVRFHGREELVARHLLPALVARPLLAESGRLLDVGSGAGLPGVPLLATCLGWQGVLLEPRVKRWAFLRTVVRELDLPAEAVRARYQELKEDRGCFDVIAVRALGHMAELLAWARHRLEPTGCVLLWTTGEGLERLGGLSGWHVVSSPMPASERAVIARLQPSFT